MPDIDRLTDWEHFDVSQLHTLSCRQLQHLTRAAGLDVAMNVGGIKARTKQDIISVVKEQLQVRPMDSAVAAVYHLICQR